MKNIKYIVLGLLLAFSYLNISAQGVRIYKKDKSVYIVPYTELDSIVAYGADEVPQSIWVDLGLPSGVKWASCNVGASSPEGYGDYFAWGEISTKEDYSEKTSLTSGKKLDNISGIPQYDAATANWGDGARMPTEIECEELMTHCTSVWTSRNGVNGRLVTGPNGNSIFLPAAGCWYGTLFDGAEMSGSYWGSISYEVGDRQAGYLHLDGEGFHWYWSSRSEGRSVRPVRD